MTLRYSDDEKKNRLCGQHMIGEEPKEQIMKISGRPAAVVKKIPTTTLSIKNEKRFIENVMIAICLSL